MKRPRPAPRRPTSKAKAKRPGAPTVAAPAPSPRAPTYDDLLAIARLIESGSRFSEFRLRSGDIEVEVKRANGVVSPVAPSAPAASSASALAAPAMPAVAANDQSAQARAAQIELPAGSHVVKSPMVGTFYRSPEPGAPAFVAVGARVKRDTVVCIIEVMKLMSSITAGVAGVVTHVLVENAHPVETGQPLLAIRPEK